MKESERNSEKCDAIAGHVAMQLYSSTEVMSEGNRGLLEEAKKDW
jgi:hypothetical protein